MKRRALLGLVCVALTGCSHTAPAATLGGQWTPVSAELGGQDFPIANFAGATLRLTSDTYEFGGDKGTYSVLSTSSPAQMDIHGSQGPNAGRTIPAIYGVAGDQLTVCYQLGSGPRPSDFSSPTGTRVLLVHYRRSSDR
jgi:uncharacterized protein (TIGR03067 family)